MEITCRSCQTKLNIPDGKMIPGKSVTINCPKCRNKFVMDIPAPAQDPKEGGVEPDTGQQNGQGKQVSQPGKTQDEKQPLPDLYQEGLKLALVAVNDDSLAESLQAAVEKLGYKYVRASNIRESISRMREHQFDLVLTSEGFDKIDLDQSPVLEYINHMPMSERRTMFLCLVGEHFTSMEPFRAFSMSANLVVQTKDIPKIANILKQALAAHEYFYRVFMETLEEVGKSDKAGGGFYLPG